MTSAAERARRRLPASEDTDLRLEPLSDPQGGAGAVTGERLASQAVHAVGHTAGGIGQGSTSRLAGSHLHALQRLAGNYAVASLLGRSPTGPEVEEADEEDAGSGGGAEPAPASDAEDAGRASASAEDGESAGSQADGGAGESAAEPEPATESGGESEGAAEGAGAGVESAGGESEGGESAGSQADGGAGESAAEPEPATESGGESEGAAEDAGAGAGAGVESAGGESEGGESAGSQADGGAGESAAEPEPATESGGESEGAAEGAGAGAGAGAESAGGESEGGGGASAEGASGDGSTDADADADGEVVTVADDYGSPPSGEPAEAAEAARAGIAGFVDGGRVGTAKVGDGHFVPNVPQAFTDGGRTGSIKWAGGGGAGPHGNQGTGTLQTQDNPVYESRSLGATKESEAWIKEGTGKIDVVRSWLGADPGDQGNGHYVTPAAATRFNTHETFHVTSTSAIYGSTIKKMLDRVLQWTKTSGGGSSVGTGFTQMGAISQVKSAVGWGPAIDAFASKDTDNNKPMGNVDTNDKASGTYPVDYGPGKVGGKDYQHRVCTPSEPVPA